MAFSAEIREKVPPELQQDLTKRDGAAILGRKLPQLYKPEQITGPSIEQRVWELIGLFYFNQPERYFEALGIFLALYQHMLDAQKKSGERVHKGMPLLWAAECFALAECAVLRKRYLMLALCEDAISGKGVIAPESTGVYFRLVWPRDDRCRPQEIRRGMQSIGDARCQCGTVPGMGTSESRSRLDD
jgi:hypothetical protein